MDPNAPVRFIRLHGRIIPIRAPIGAVKGAAFGVTGTRDVAKITAASAVHHALRKEKDIPGRTGFKLGSEAAAVAGGLISGATMGHGLKGFAIGHGTAMGIDVGSSALGIAAYAGKGHAKARAKGIARQELTNQALGWSTFAATALAVPSSRKRLAEVASKVVAFGRKALLRD